MEPVILAENLSVAFPGKTAVREVSFALYPGELLALVGGSGSGKSMLCRALLGLPPPGAAVSYDRLVRPPPERMSLVMQDAQTALDPSMPVGGQIAEAGGKTPADPVRCLARAGADDPELRARQYPHELSGGARQRAAAAVALAMNPLVILADEPTTSLDASLRGRIMELFGELRADGTAVLFVTHDLGLVRDYADRALILQDGRIVERGRTADLFAAPQADYTKELLRHAALGSPQNHTHGKAPSAETPLLSARALRKTYPLGRGASRTVLDGFDLDIYPGEILGLCGPSGCGKSTLCRLLAGLEKPTGGEISARPGLNVQMIFQDSVSALNPRMTVRQILHEPLYLRGKKRPDPSEAREWLEAVELTPELLPRRRHELSGGQRQRVAIARACAARPDLILADEPVSSLDAATCSRIVHLLRRLRDERDLTILLISHDQNLLGHVCDRILRLG